MPNFLLSTHFFSVVFGLILLSGCGNNPRSAGLEYAPEMYHAVPLEAYTQTSYNKVNPDGKNMREPVSGTVARNKSDYYYPYANTPEGYELAGKELVNPVPFSAENLAEGKRLYGLYCAHCHGKDGKGGAVIVETQKYPYVPPSYDSDRVKKLSDGKIFHSITHGIGNMGAHGGFLSPEERWKVVHFINSVKGVVKDTVNKTKQ